MRSKVILAIGAHADDTDFSASGTVAKFIKDGATAYYLICTNGNKGSDDPKITSEKLAQIRRNEQENAAKVLGVKKIFFLDHNDGELEVTLKLKEEIVRVIRQVKPTTVITMDPTMRFSVGLGYINHPDHLAMSEAALSAIYPLARDRLTFPDHEREGLKPWKVGEVLLSNFDDANCFVDISQTFEIKLKALKEHKSQIKDMQKMEDQMKKRCSQLGKKIKVKYAESFRRLLIDFV